MGLLRLYLATVVAMAHLELTVLQSRHMVFWGHYYLGFNAGYAVMAFYMISGFLISMVLASKYKAAPGSFYAKRGVRIFSLYLPICAIAFLFIDGTLRDFAAASPLQRVTNFSLLGSDWLLVLNGPSLESSWLALPNPLHQAWTLSAELTFYLTAPWLLRSRIASGVALVASVAVRFALVHQLGHSDRWLYLFLPSTFLFFLMGHWARVLAEQVKALRAPRVALGLIASCFGILIVRSPSWDTGGFWVAMICLALALPGLFALTKDNALLNWLGALSYPMYLVHNMVRMMTIETWHFDRFLPAIPHVAAATELMAFFLVCVFVAAVAAHYLLERPCAWLLESAVRHVARLIGGARLRLRSAVPQRQMAIVPD